MRYLAVFLLCILLGAIPASAQTPTNTPPPSSTPGPAPSPTGQYSNLRVTPTAFSITPSPMPEMNTNLKAGEMADSAINFYRFINIGHVVDFVMLILMGVITIRYMFRLIGKFKGE